MFSNNRGERGREREGERESEWVSEWEREEREGMEGVGGYTDRFTDKP